MSQRKDDFVLKGVMEPLEIKNHALIADTGYDPLSTQPEWGNDPGLKTKKPHFVEIIHRAKFAMLCLDFINGDRQRRYFYVNENSIERNDPSSCSCYLPGIPFITGNNPIGCFELCSLPPNSCCPGHDHIVKTYFDRGIFDRQNFCWAIGFWAGEPSFYANEVKHTVCCNECCPLFDRCMSCYFPSVCGERVRYIRAEYCCWCVPMRTGNCNNCCGLCGPQTDMPYETCLVPVTTGLSEGEAENMVISLRNSVIEWNEYTLKGGF